MSVFNWVIALTPADTGLSLEVDAVNATGFPNGPPWPKTTVTEMGNGFYIFSDGAPPRDGYLLARLAGGGPPLAMRGITGVDVLLVQPDGSVIVSSVNCDINGNLNGSVAGVVQGDPYFSPAAPWTFVGPGMGDLGGRVLGDTHWYTDQGTPPPPFVGPGVNVLEELTAAHTGAGTIGAAIGSGGGGGGGGDPTTIAAAVWDRLTTLLTTPGSVGAFLLAKLGALGSAPVILQSALDPAGAVIRVIIGDSYEFSTAGRYAGEWLDTSDLLAGRPITSVAWETNIAGLAKTPTLDTIGGHVHVALELSKTDTAGLAPNIHPRWALVFTLSDGDQLTWARGVLIPHRRT
jgi:hypothetical protein